MRVGEHAQSAHRGADDEGAAIESVVGVDWVTTSRAGTAAQAHYSTFQRVDGPGRASRQAARRLERSERSARIAETARQANGRWLATRQQPTGEKMDTITIAAVNQSCNTAMHAGLEDLDTQHHQRPGEHRKPKGWPLYRSSSRPSGHGPYGQARADETPGEQHHEPERRDERHSRGNRKTGSTIATTIEARAQNWRAAANANG